MSSVSIVSLCALALALAGTALAQQQPRISSNNVDLILEAAPDGGDIMVKTGSTSCTSDAPCPLGATLGGIQANVTDLATTCARSADVSEMYLSQANAQATYTTQAALAANYPTRAEVVAMDAAIQAGLEELANMTNHTLILQGTGVMLSNGSYLDNFTVVDYHEFVSLSDLMSRIVEIHGSLEVSGITRITTFASIFQSLVTVHGDVTLSMNPSLTTLDGLFPNLATVDGSIIITGNGAVTTLGSSFPSLTSAGGLQVVNNARLASGGTSFNSLATLAGNVSVLSNPVLSSLPLSALRTVSGVVTVDNNPGLTGAMSGVTSLGGLMVSNMGGSSMFSTFSALVTVGPWGLTIKNSAMSSISNAFASVTTISGPLVFDSLANMATMSGSFTATTTVGGLTLKSCPGITTSFFESFANLATVNGDFLITSNTNIRSIAANALGSLTSINGSLVISGNNQFATTGGAFNSLTTVRGLTVSGTALTANIFAEFGGLTTINGDLLITGTSLTSLGSNAFTRLATITGTLGFTSNSAMRSMGTNAFPALVSMGGFVWSGMSTSFSFANSLPNLRYINGRDLGASFNPATGFFSGSMVCNGCNIASFKTLLDQRPIILGTLSVYNVALTGGQFPAGFGDGLVFVGGSFQLGQSGRNFAALQRLDNMFNGLQYVGGDFNVYYLQSLVSASGSFSALKTIGGSFRWYYCSGSGFTSMAGFFPNLETVGGTYFYLYYNQYVTTLAGAFPKLTQVNGYFYLYYNRRLTSLDGTAFTRLKTVSTYMYIYYNSMGTSGPGLTTMNGAFPALESVGYLYMYYNYNLQSITNSFNSLKTINSYFYFYYSYYLATISNSFQALETVGTGTRFYYLYALQSVTNSFTSLRTNPSPYWYAVGCGSTTTGITPCQSGDGMLAWCTATSSIWCPAASNPLSSNQPNDALSCCRDYCSTNDC